MDRSDLVAGAGVALIGAGVYTQWGPSWALIWLGAACLAAYALLAIAAVRRRGPR